MGLTLDRDHIATKDEEALLVWKDNWDSLTAFLAVETQWRVVATMERLIWTGIDYNALDVVMRRLKLPEHTFEHVMIMEAEAIAVFSEASA